MNTQGTPSYHSIKHTDIALYSKCPRFAYSSVGHDVNIAGTQLVIRQYVVMYGLLQSLL